MTGVKVEPAPRIRATARGVGRVNCRSAGGPVLLYALVAFALMWPYRTAEVREAGDLPVVIAGVIEARNALREGQFPVRVAPDLAGGMRYPLFQYYGNFPYSAAAVVSIVGHVGPYAAWKIVTLLGLIVGGLFTYLSAVRLSRDRLAAILAGAVFMTAPYLLADLNARGAFAELVALNLVPAAFYFTWRCFTSRRLGYVPFCALAWTLLGLSHNISYAYAVLFVGLFLLTFVGPGVRVPARVARLAAAGVLHATLMLWFVAPQLYTLGTLQITGEQTDPYLSALFNPLRILLAPVLTAVPRVAASSPGLGLQVGWPILGGVLLAIGACVRRCGSRNRWMIGRLLLLFGLAFFMVWSPVDFWRRLPHVFWFVQFPYRLLLFVSFWGALLTACGLSAWRRQKTGAAVALPIFVLLGAAVASYLPGPGRPMPGLVERLEAAPDMNGVSTMYLLAPPGTPHSLWQGSDPTVAEWWEHVRQIEAGEFGPVVRVADTPAEHRGDSVRFKCVADASADVDLPVLFYPCVVVRDNGRPTRCGPAGRFVRVHVSPGRHRIDVRFAGIGWANVLGGVAWFGILPAGLILAGARNRRRFAARPNVSVRIPLAGFAALAIGAAIPLSHPARLLFDRTPRLRANVSSQLSARTGAENVLDGDPATAWIAADAGPAVLKITASRPVVLRRITLEPRQTVLLEAWADVRVVLFLGHARVYDRSHSIPDAARRPVQAIDLPPTRADAIELDFSSPITETPAGGKVPPSAVRPGYREVRLQWDE